MSESTKGNGFAIQTSGLTRKFGDFVAVNGEELDMRHKTPVWYTAGVSRAMDQIISHLKGLIRKRKEDAIRLEQEKDMMVTNMLRAQGLNGNAPYLLGSNPNKQPQLMAPSENKKQIEDSQSQTAEAEVC